MIALNTSRGQDDFGPTASWDRLQLRADLARRLRTFFDQRGFLEVETPLLSADTVVDRHLDPLPVTLPDDPRDPQNGRTLWLQTSPEFGMKRLLAAGAAAIYQMTRAFRSGERGALHNPEFTLVEWYRCSDSLSDGIQLLADFCQHMLGRGPAKSLSYQEAFERHVGVDPHSADVAQLSRAADARGVPHPALSPEDIDAWLNWLLTELVEPQLGQQQPTILYGYPASQAALAQVSPGPPVVSERFELYVNGIELANGYHELVDPDELRRRSQVANNQRAADGKYRLPEESRLLAAMHHGLPDCCGVALGFDRLVMVASGARCIADVMTFPIDRA